MHYGQSNSPVKLESRPELTYLIGIGILLIGIPLFWLGRNYSGYGDSAFAGFVLGCFLIGISVLALVVGEQRSVELDEQRGRIVLDITRRVGGSRQVIIPFQDIERFTVLHLGEYGSFSAYYDLGAVLRSGKTVYLFGGCAFDGRMNREWIEELRSRFEQAAANRQAG